MKTIDMMNAELQDLADEIRQEQVALEYEELMDMLFQELQCQQYQNDMEFYNEFG